MTLTTYKILYITWLGAIETQLLTADSVAEAMSYCYNRHDAFSVLSVNRV